MPAGKVELIKMSTNFETSGLIVKRLAQALYMHNLLLEPQLNVLTKSWEELDNFWCLFRFLFNPVTRSDIFSQIAYRQNHCGFFLIKNTAFAILENHTVI